MKTKLSLTLIFVFCISITFSQDTLLLLTGKIYSGQITEISNNFIIIKTEGKKLNPLKLIYNDELFSFVKNNNETIIYKPDSINESTFNALEMKYFIKGTQDGKKFYHAPFATIGGFAAGMTGGVFGFWGSIIPTSYVLITGLKTPKVKTSFPDEDKITLPANQVNLSYGLKFSPIKEVMPTNDQIYNSFYEYGYNISAKDKKIKNSIKGSVLGVVTFIAAAMIFTHM